MTTIVIACAAALVATALAVIVFVLGRRSRRRTDARLLEVAAELDERMAGDGARPLGCARARAGGEPPHPRLGELGGSIDLDEVLARTLDAAGALEGVDAAVISIAVEGDEPLVAAAGLGGAAPPATISGPPDGGSPRSIVVEYGYGRADEAVEGGPIRAGSRRAADLGRRAARLSHRLLAQWSRGIRRVECCGARGARAPGRPGDRQRAPLPRSAPARRPRRADGTAQPALLPRDAAARGRAGAPVQPQPRARRVRPRRLQGDQRPDRTPRGRRGARRGGSSASATSCAPPTSPAASAATSSR